MEPKTPDATCGYTKAELCEIAGVTPRLIDDWEQVGLIDRPRRVSRGRGGMAPATWSENQKELLVQLVAHRQRTPHIPPLCNLPVWLWLWWGDDYVPLRQVRRAVKTWGAAAAPGSKRGVEAAARSMARTLRQPGTHRRAPAALVDAVVNTPPGARSAGGIAEAANRVLGLRGGGDTVGPAGAVVSGEIYAEVVVMLTKTARDLDAIPDDLFEDARAVIQFAEAEYRERQPVFARDAALGHMFTPRDLNASVNEACKDLLLAMALLMEQRATAHLAES